MEKMVEINCHECVSEKVLMHTTGNRKGESTLIRRMVILYATSAFWTAKHLNKFTLDTKTLKCHLKEWRQQNNEEKNRSTCEAKMLPFKLCQYADAIELHKTHLKIVFLNTYLSLETFTMYCNWISNSENHYFVQCSLNCLQVLSNRMI